jgi:hypothetical protein
MDEVPALVSSSISFEEIRKKTFTYRLSTKDVVCEFTEAKTIEYGWISRAEQGDVDMKRVEDEGKLAVFRTPRGKELEITRFIVTSREDAILDAQDFQCLSRLFDNPIVERIQFLRSSKQLECKELSCYDILNCHNKLELSEVAEDYKGTLRCFAITYKASAWQELSKGVTTIL